jgi:hypothetical protein
VSNFEDAVALAMISGDVVLGTLGDILTLFGEDGDNSLITGLFLLSARRVSRMATTAHYVEAADGSISNVLMDLMEHFIP